MKNRSGVPDLETVLGHRFQKPELLQRALTHRSQAYEQRLAHPEPGEDAPLDTADSDNEQLEFLGDAILGFLVAEELCRTYPGLREGALTRLRAELVSRHNLGLVAARLNLGEFLLLGRGEERSGGRRNSTLLANCIEAVVAALYLDGGIGPARAFVLREIIEPEAAGLCRKMLHRATISDYKSALQERLQAQKRGQPEYSVKAESGPDHRKRFLVEVAVAKIGAPAKPLARGLGNTKKKAEQEAARRAIIKLERVAPAAKDPEAVAEIDSDE
ncbi:MAG: ribonuclease III [Silvibacterium sp.]|nr:ribonuclease III [Silvibacterium sp.]